MEIQNKVYIILAASIVLMTGCLLSSKNNRYVKDNIQANMCSYQDVKLIIDTLTDEERVDKKIFHIANFHVFDSYDSLCLYYKIVSDSVAFGWFSGKRNDTIYNIILALTKEQIIYNIQKKATFFDSQGRFYYIGDVSIFDYPKDHDGPQDGIRVYMDSISPVCADDMDEKFEVEYFPILKRDSITIKFH